MAQPTLMPAPEHRHRRFVRVSSVSVASVLAVLIGTSVLPPLVADQSDRAVVNAPVTLMTAPIAGDVSAIPVKVGDVVERGTLMAQISNDRLDRSTAIQLAGRVSELRERALAAESKRASNEAYLDALDRAIREQSAQTSQVLRGQVEELKAKIASALASGEEKKVLMDRQIGMVSRNVASPDMVKSTTQSYAAALHEKEAAEAKLGQKTVQLDGVTRGLFVGDELRGLAELAQKRLSITYDTQRLKIEETELKAAMADQQRLLDRENTRLDKLAASEITSSAKGIVYNVNAAVGRHVSAGDSLSSLVDCERSFVVAIFSYRQGQNLQVGSPVTISGEPSGPRRGVVTEILPKTSDTVDATYAVPFPQTERRELYVLVKPEPLPVQTAAAEDPAGTACGVGRWVTVSRDAGWVPSTSVVWRDIGGSTASLAAKAGNAAPDMVRGAVDHAEAAISYAGGLLRQAAASAETLPPAAEPGHSETQGRSAHANRHGADGEAPDTRAIPPSSAAIAAQPDLEPARRPIPRTASAERPQLPPAEPPTESSALPQPPRPATGMTIAMPPLPPARPSFEARR